MRCPIQQRLSVFVEVYEYLSWFVIYAFINDTHTHTHTNIYSINVHAPSPRFSLHTHTPQFVFLRILNIATNKSWYAQIRDSVNVPLNIVWQGMQGTQPFLHNGCVPECITNSDGGKERHHCTEICVRSVLQIWIIFWGLEASIRFGKYITDNVYSITYLDSHLS